MKTGKKRTFSICVSDIPKEKILVHENGKKYLNLETWDNDEPDKYDNDFSVSISFNKNEIEAKKEGADIKRIYLGNGRIWEVESKIRESLPDEEHDDVPF